MEKILKEIFNTTMAFYLNAHHSIDSHNDVTLSLSRSMAGELIDMLHEYINLVDGDEDRDLPEEEPLIRFQKPDEKHLRR